jgi:stringent starvation protein B
MSSNKTMLDNRPYVLRSTLAWIEDSLCTPLLTVNP